MLKVKETGKHDLYKKAFLRVLNECSEYQVHGKYLKPYIKRLVVYGLKTINSKKNSDIITIEESEYDFQFAEIVKSFMSSLTPGEFVAVFPPQKIYDGAKWQTKDYFTTMEAVKSLDPGKPIGEEIEDFLWDYMNTEVHIFLVNLFGIASDLRRLDGHPGIIEEWCAENGITTFTLNKDSQGKEYFINNRTGKTVKIKPKRHLHLVKK